MTGRAEVNRLKQRLDATFKRTQHANVDAELRSDLARYLCVLVSGYIEKSVVEFILEHARQRSAPTLQRFVEIRTKNFANPNASRIQNLLGSFDPEWQKNLNEFLIGEPKDAIDSIVALRNKIAHGGSVGLTYSRIRDYYEQAQRVIDQVEKLCVPVE